MISVAQALKTYSQVLTPLAAENVAIQQATDRVLAAPPKAAVDLPIFTQSAVDGYALRSADVLDNAVFELVGEVPAGPIVDELQISAGQACRIFTGGRLPPGADTIARQEVVERADNTIKLTQPIAAAADTRFKGEELTAGAVLAEPGQTITPGLLAALAMAGVAEVTVFKQPKIIVLITGDELAQAGEPLNPGQIYDANGPLVASFLRDYQPELIYVEDTEAAVTQAIQHAVDHADLVITTGGVSVGDRDFIPAVAQKVGVQQQFWKVAQKPGKPIWFGTKNNTALIGLPGNPAAVLIGLLVHVQRILDVLAGLKNPAPQWQSGVLAAPVKPDASRDRFVRMVVSTEKGQVTLSPLPKQASHMLSNLAAAGALVYVEAAPVELSVNAVVPWIALK